MKKTRNTPLGAALVALCCRAGYAAATFTPLGDLPGGTFFSHAFGVSADGTVVVGNSRSASGVEAFRWTSGGGMVGLGDLPGGTFESDPWDISADGSVIVGSGNSALGDEAFRWTGGAGMQNLRELLIAGGATGLTGWTLTQASAISADGRTIIGHGRNPRGQTEAWIATLPQVPEPAGADFIAIAGGNSHSLALKSDGSLAAWGDNFLGQTDVPAGNDFVAVTSGCCHGLALRADGSLAGWGGNNAVVDGEFVEVDFGQADVPAGNDFMAIEAGALYSRALNSDGAIVGWGSNEFGQTNMPASNEFVAVEGGAFHSLALKTDGSLAARGLNNYGQTSVPAGNDFVSIAAGDDHNLALKSDGSLVGWGRNNFGQRNVPSGNDFVAIAAGTAHSLALKSDGSIVGWGTNLDGAISVPPGHNFVAIDAGDYHSLAIQLLSPLSGDYNNDGSVDAADYVMMRTANGTNPTLAGYKLWRTSFGAMAGSGAALHSAVPEPASGTLVAIAFVAAFARQRRRASSVTAALAAAVCVAISAGRPPAATAPTEIVSFGDSLSDVGNLYVDSGRTVPSPPYFNGRFSNGPVWVERLAGQLNLPAPAPSLSGGANYAWGGAETGSGLSFYDTPNVGMQIDSYLGSHTPADTTLFTVWAGANDLFVHQSDPTPLVANLSGHLSKLAAAGGQHFLVGNLPPLGKFPSVLGTPASPLLDALTVEFNNLLSSELDNLQASFGVTIYRLDAYNIYQSIFADPAAYGLTNVTKPAFNDTTVVPNPDQYLFWDGDHPTRVVSQLLGDAAVALVPVLPGDFNSDGSADAADYVVWRKGLGTTYMQNDYDTWRAHFGRAPSVGLSAGSGAAGYPLGASAEPLSVAVPEPATLMMLAMAIVMFFLTVARLCRNLHHRNKTSLVLGTRLPLFVRRRSDRS